MIPTDSFEQPSAVDQVSSFSFNMLQIEHHTDIDIRTLTQSLAASSAYPQTDTAQLYDTHPDSCAHMV